MYMNAEMAKKIYIACIDELYRNSSPSITWKEINEKYAGKPRSEFYMKHTITEETYERITEKYRKMLTREFRPSLSWFLLDYAPTFKKEE